MPGRESRQRVTSARRLEPKSHINAWKSAEPKDSEDQLFQIMKNYFDIMTSLSLTRTNVLKPANDIYSVGFVWL